MKEPERAVPEKLVILAYWPHRQAGELNIGYGVHRNFILSQGVASIFSLATGVFGLLFEPKVRPAIRAWVRFALIFVISMPLAILSLRMRKYTGYYQIDDQGRPVHFLGTALPESIKGRFGLTRKKFLEQLKYG